MLVRDGASLAAARRCQQRSEHLLQSTGQDIGLFRAFEESGVLLAKERILLFEMFKVAPWKSGASGRVGAAAPAFNYASWLDCVVRSDAPGRPWGRPAVFLM
jgi:hypothetical protein